MNLSKTDGVKEAEIIHENYRVKEPLRAESHACTEPDAKDSETEAEDLMTETRDTNALKREVDTIRLSLDVLKDTLIMQQAVLARDFEARIRNVYDDVINDINGIRKRVNDIGDTFEPETKFKTWTPLMPFRKDVLQSVYNVKSPPTRKLKGSKSVDFVDKKGTDADKTPGIDFDKFHSKTIFSQRQSWLGSSHSSISSNCSSRKLVPGFGCCFGGDGKTIPFRSHRARHRANRRHRHSWGPSRSGSRSTLDDDDDFEDKSCLCGGMADDWRVKVVPYMWEGWPVPGIDRVDMHKLRERMEHMEAMRHEVVHVHNEYRRQHGCPELSVTTDLAREAQQWSDILAMRGYAQYSDSQSRGENILVVDIEDNLSGRQIVDTWYRESRIYSYKQPGWQRGTSNFTQMIWKSSQFIGVGIAKFPYNNTYVIVVQYQPPGNINKPGMFRRNVPVPIIGKNTGSESSKPGGKHSNKNSTDFDNRSRELKHSFSLPNDLSKMETADPFDDEEEEYLKDKETKSSRNNIETADKNNKNKTGDLDQIISGLDIDIDNLSKELADDHDSDDESEDNSSEDDEDKEDHIASVSASLASSVYDHGILKDEGSFRFETLKHERKTEAFDVSPKWSDTNAHRQSTNGRKITSV
ncbi:uncharacterized protein LOC123548119 [Mercenaria mercenaria]|uniref:uncharacterized protein LOC123548119 n=1 Tax=Mercenaria mercenaria TaxID=6596 RepID=UPI00234E49C8|nr:uncharacterized protein LOC123548119 [Mercenaria mercenaria]